MTGARYTRYTLRLAGGAAGLVPPSGPPPAPAVARFDRGAATAGGVPGGQAAASWVDDWSGALPPSAHDPAALEYRHPAAVALLQSLGVGWQEQDGGDTLVFWLPEDAEDEPASAAALAGLGGQGDLRAEPQRPGWEEAWKAFHEPQRIGRLFVRPPWREPRAGLLDVVVEAGMAFGTGGHATTRQCLEEIQEIAPGSLLDLGCGSGVLAIAARRLGFAPVWGIDVDAVAVAEAEANAARNRLAASFSRGDGADPALPLPAADTVVANIALAPLVRLGARFFAAGPRVTAGPRPRRLILAGLLVTQRDEALDAYPGYRPVHERDDGEWLMLRLEPAA